MQKPNSRTDVLLIDQSNNLSLQRSRLTPWCLSRIVVKSAYAETLQEGAILRADRRSGELYSLPGNVRTDRRTQRA